MTATAATGDAGRRSDVACPGCRNMARRPIETVMSFDSQEGWVDKYQGGIRTKGIGGERSRGCGQGLAFTR
ncbi:MAG: hypothetical protein RQ752_16630, partial [Thermohalobaculum sp.]|nr:hypothetical protein [Thermohalobaculum sp.]